jgi:hypothetical protein
VIGKKALFSLFHKQPFSVISIKKQFCGWRSSERRQKIDFSTMLDFFTTQIWYLSIVII